MRADHLALLFNSVSSFPFFLYHISQLSMRKETEISGVSGLGDMSTFFFVFVTSMLLFDSLQ